MTMAGTKISFDNAAGQALAAVLDRPPGAVSGFALFAHCFTCSKDLKSARRLSSALNDAGIAVLRFDFTGLGQSEGEFADTSFSSNVDDLTRAAAWMTDHAMPPTILIGHSLGGAAVLAAAGAIPQAKAVVTIGAPSRPSHIKRLFEHASDEIEAEGGAEVDLGGRPFTISRQFAEDLEQHDFPSCIAKLRKPLLVMHAPIDQIVSVDNAAEMFTAATHPKSFVSLDDADHLLSRDKDAEYAGRVLAAWSSRYTDIALPPRPADATSETIAVTAAGGFLTSVVSAGHRLVADEPTGYGGTDLGPTPYGLLSAALASCTSMTLQMYARKKRLDLELAEVRITHDKIHAKDCRDCDTVDGHIDEFRRELRLTGKLSGDERKRLVEIADRCPVHRTLHGEIKVRTKLID
jgi:putative redox protein